MEKIKRPVSGYLALLVAILLLALAIFLFVNADKTPAYGIFGAITMAASIFLMKGLMIIYPNHSRVLNFFGKYVGSVKSNGLFFINPFYSTYKISLRSQNLQGQT